MSLFDADGKEITVGCTVRHKHEPAPAGELDKSHPERCHNFFGSSTVLAVTKSAVIVRPTTPRHIATHLPENLLVVAR